MKIRTGFVSNSSSSSFMIFGINVSEKKLLNTIEKFKLTDQENKINKYFKNKNETITLDLIIDDIKEYREFEWLPSIFKAVTDNELSIETPQYGENVYIGLEPYSFKDDETFMEFKLNILKALNDFGFEKELKDLKWYKECWYDG